LANRTHEYFAPELRALRMMAETGPVVSEPQLVQATATGLYVVRAVAMVFDYYLHGKRQPEGFSRNA
jgi:hypothetical protein